MVIRTLAVANLYPLGMVLRGKKMRRTSRRGVRWRSKTGTMDVGCRILEVASRRDLSRIHLVCAVTLLLVIEVGALLCGRVRWHGVIFGL